MTETDDFDGLVGQHVRELRGARGMNQEQLAAKVTERGLPFRQQMIAKIENGQRPLRLQEAVELISALGVDIDVLLNGPDVTDELQRMQQLTRLENAARVFRERVSRLREELADAEAGLAAARREIAELEKKS